MLHLHRFDGETAHAVRTGGAFFSCSTMKRIDAKGKNQVLSNRRARFMRLTPEIQHRLFRLRDGIEFPVEQGEEREGRQLQDALRAFILRLRKHIRNATEIEGAKLALGLQRVVMASISLGGRHKENIYLRRLQTAEPWAIKFKKIADPINNVLFELAQAEYDETKRNQKQISLKRALEEANNKYQIYTQTEFDNRSTHLIVDFYQWRTRRNLTT